MTRASASLMPARAMRMLAGVVLAISGLLVAREPVSAGPQPPVIFAPPDRPGPALDIDPRALARSLHCSPPHSVTGRRVLLVPGTGTIPSVDYAWNYERAFTQRRIAWCAVTLPNSADGDIQVAGEFIVAAIRSMAAGGRGKIDILGWSQGGMVPRWALRFWPDTRALVANVVGLAPSNHGTVTVAHACAVTCIPALRQQSRASRFLAALNSYAETFPGIAYTNVYTRHDDIVQPNLDATGSSSLHTGRGVIANVAVQEACPANMARHFALGTYDPVGYAIVIDALFHSGRGASARRISRAVCGSRFAPGIDPATFDRDFAALNAYVDAHRFAVAPTRTEPPLAPYVFAHTVSPTAASLSRLLKSRHAGAQPAGSGGFRG